MPETFILLKKTKLKKYQTHFFNIFQSIICNDHLRIENDDSLFDIINEYFEEEENNDEDDFYDITSFYEEIKMKNLSDTKFKDFLLKINPSKITVKLWRNICDRICNEKVEKTEEEENKKTIYKRK